ncbi:hypothetical protein GALMADRAFT_245146 [Galerina marginata CBS 339.88]|uniref:CCHC-type domain-containing protein n=1 Tax=Galerina marginata (strain CBS 339.88) TaxID=685588 RepID=A0A067T4K8_GALM3|nr:hypothetical protein GALMADRAFT_245146 [Galerina marginata CBS 339.88]
MRENLAAMGQSPSDDDFYSIILGSLPPSYDPHISAISATSSVLGKTLSPDELMRAVTDEFDRRVVNGNSPKEENKAFYTNESGKGRRGGGGSKKDAECFNCSKRGHFAADCWAEGGGKEGQGPRGRGKAKGSSKEAAAAIAKARDEEEEEAAWFALTAFDSSSQDLGEVSHRTVTLSDVDSADLMSDDSDGDCEMPGADETSDEESGSESEEESDDGSIDEEGESMPRPTFHPRLRCLCHYLRLCRSRHHPI